MADSQNTCVSLQLSFLDEHGQRINAKCVITAELNALIQNKKSSDPAFDDAAAAALIRANNVGLIQAEMETTTLDGNTIGKEWRMVKDGVYKPVNNDAGIFYQEEMNGRVTFLQREYEGGIFRGTRWDINGVVTEDTWFKMQSDKSLEDISEPIPHPAPLTRTPPIFTAAP